MRAVTVLFDKDCRLCEQAHDWLDAQPKLVPMEFVAAASEEARRRFPSLDHGATLGDLTVIAHNGAVYVAERAWILCLWCLAEYRPLAERLAAPKLLPLARQGFGAVSAHRRAISALLPGRGPAGPPPARG